MSYKKAAISLFFLLFCSIHIKAQQEPLSVEEQLTLLELEMDSLSIFNLIDSILLSESGLYSELNFRLGYNSNVAIAGRNFDINQHGISPGVSYYHKKGFYADVSGFWNSSFDPKYSLTVASLGYMKFFGSNWTLTGSYDRWIYNRSPSSNSTIIDTSLRNSLNLSSGFNTKHFFASIDYNYLFGSSKAHRLIGNVAGNLSMKNVWVFDKIRIAPSFSMIYGNNDVFTYFFSTEQQERQFTRIIINTEEFRSLVSSINFSNEEQLIIRRIENNPRLDDEQKNNRTYFQVYSKNNQVLDYINNQKSDTSNKYGLMNYSFSLPIIFSINQFNLILSYTYSVPFKLPGEQEIPDPIGYFSASLTYRIPFR